MNRTAVCFAALVAACSGGPRDDNAGLSGVDGGTGEPTETTGDDDGQLLDVGTPEQEHGDCEGPPARGDATITGRVFAPNGVIPISGALVRIEDAPPAGIPDHVYCESCVEVPCETPHAVTEADGTFTLDAPSGAHHIVIQKGQFMISSEIKLEPGVNEVGADATRLPGHRDAAAGMWIPNIALAWGEYDRLENGLAKLGLAEVTGDTTFAAGTEVFDIWSNAGNEAPPPSSMGTFADLLRNPEAMDRYHIIFVPCTSSPHEALLNDPQIRENIRTWVEKGGKWYVSDWSLAFLEAPFPQYQNWWEDDFFGGPLLDEFDTVGKILDDDLLAWLDELPPGLKDINPLNPDAAGAHPAVDELPRIELVDLWSTIKKTPPVWTDDGEGGQVNVGHKTWIEAPGGGGDGAPVNKDWPMTVTGEYGCGRLLFTSYHTVEWTEAYAGLTPQELVLAYLILEFGVCQTPYSPPPVG